MHNQEETTAGLTGSTELSSEIIRPVPKARPRKTGEKSIKKIMTLTDTPEKGPKS